MKTNKNAHNTLISSRYATGIPFSFAVLLISVSISIVSRSSADGTAADIAAPAAVCCC
jgi:hypothetical protein